MSAAMQVQVGALDVPAFSSTGGTDRPRATPGAAAQQGCPRAYPGQMIDRVTGELTWRRCRSLHCPYCLPIQARQRAAAVALAGPTHLLTLTQTGADFAEIHSKLKRFREHCRRLGMAFGWFWAAEGNPRGTGTHVHAWLRPAGHLDVESLAAVAQRAGLGSVLELAEARGPMGAVGARLEGVGRASYVLKEALIAPSTTAHLTEQQEAFLSLNGHRLGHNSRGFWRDRFGRRLNAVREAEQEAGRLRRAQRSDTSGAPCGAALSASE